MILIDQTTTGQNQPQSVNRISSVPLMDGAAAALGLTLAQSQRKTIVVDGDARLLIEQGSLNVIGMKAHANLLHVVIHNGTQFTGLANLKSPVANFSFAQAARDAGYPHADALDDPKEWTMQFKGLPAHDGPTFVELLAEPMPLRMKPGVEQGEMPDIQFERMALETHVLQSFLAQRL